jgi:hypothetical protein
MLIALLQRLHRFYTVFVKCGVWGCGVVGSGSDAHRFLELLGLTIEMNTVDFSDRDWQL